MHIQFRAQCIYQKAQQPVRLHQNFSLYTMLKLIQPYIVVACNPIDPKQAHTKTNAHRQTQTGSSDQKQQEKHLKL